MSAATERQAALSQREQAIADCDYILEFSDQPEGLVVVWRDALCDIRQLPYAAYVKITERAEEIQEQRKAQNAIAAE